MCYIAYIMDQNNPMGHTTPRPPISDGPERSTHQFLTHRPHLTENTGIILHPLNDPSQGLRPQFRINPVSISRLYFLDMLMPGSMFSHVLEMSNFTLRFSCAHISLSQCLQKQAVDVIWGYKIYGW